MLESLQNLLDSSIAEKIKHIIVRNLLLRIFSQKKIEINIVERMIFNEEKGIY